MMVATILDSYISDISAFSALTLLVEQGADLHITQLMPLPLTISCSSKSRFVLPEWFCFSGAGLPRL